MNKKLTAQDIELFLTDSAIRQILLMEENDYTLENHFFRIKIGGKGCGGFTYETGFSELHQDDLVIEKYFKDLNKTLRIIMDPFTAFYTQKGTLDYLLDPEKNDEGFIVENADESNHKGKFFKDTSKLPPWAKL